MAVRIRKAVRNAISGFTGIMLSFSPGRADAQAPVQTGLKRILVLDKSRSGSNGHFESRRDFNHALASLAAEKGFAITTIGQDDPSSSIAREFSAAGLAGYQVVIFAYNDGVQAFLNADEKANFEAYVERGGGFISVHSAQDFIANWPWLTNALVQCYYGPHGINQPTASMAHDAEGTREGTETLGIFKGFEPPGAFLDEFYSFRASPRGTSGVTILVTVDERTYSKPVDGPMGDDHPVVWTNAVGMGRVVNLSLGHSWSTNNVYAAKDGYLAKLLYGTLRYAAGDFIGCTDSRYVEYNPDATRTDWSACKTVLAASVSDLSGKPVQALVSGVPAGAVVKTVVRPSGRHEVRLLDVSGRSVEIRTGMGPAEYALPMPVRGGLYVLVVKAGGTVTRHRVTVL